MESWLESFATTNFRRSSDTAHDLKTPLNVAVLNLELLRMRVSKLAGGEDEKVNAYAKSIELELRRMARNDLLHVDAFPNRVFTGRLIEIGSEAEFTPRNVQTVEDRIKQVFGVKIRLENKEDTLRAGMSADIFFPNVK